MNGRQRLKLYISILITIIALAALIATTLVHCFEDAEQGVFDIADIVGSMLIIAGIYKFHPKGGSHDKN